MEAFCNPMIDYSNLSEIIKKQKEGLRDLISKMLKVKTKRSYSDLEKNFKNFKKVFFSLKLTLMFQSRESSDDDELLISESQFKKIPGITESGWDYKDYENMIKNDYSNVNFFTQCRNIIAKMKNNKNSWPFLKPVDPKEVPNYYETIKEPMDLQTLEGNLETGMYKTKEIFVSDLQKIFTNAKSFNKPHTIYHKYAKDIESSIQDDIKILKDN